MLLKPILVTGAVSSISLNAEIVTSLFAAFLSLVMLATRLYSPPPKNTPRPVVKKSNCLSVFMNQRTEKEKDKRESKRSICYPPVVLSSLKRPNAVSNAALWLTPLGVKDVMKASISSTASGQNGIVSVGLNMLALGITGVLSTPTNATCRTEPLSQVNIHKLSLSFSPPHPPHPISVIEGSQDCSHSIDQLIVQTIIGDRPPEHI